MWEELIFEGSYNKTLACHNIPETSFWLIERPHNNLLIALTLLPKKEKRLSLDSSNKIHNIKAYMNCNCFRPFHAIRPL